MKKLFAYLFLAGVVYVLIYLGMVSYLRWQASDLRDFCAQLETGAPLTEAQASATGQGFSSMVSHSKEIHENKASPKSIKTSIVYFTAPAQTDASCEALVKDGVIVEKKFQLSLF